MTQRTISKTPSASAFDLIITEHAVPARTLAIYQRTADIYRRANIAMRGCATTPTTVSCDTRDAEVRD